MEFFQIHITFSFNQAANVYNVPHFLFKTSLNKGFHITGSYCLYVRNRYAFQDFLKRKLLCAHLRRTTIAPWSEVACRFIDGRLSSLWITHLACDLHFKYVLQIEMTFRDCCTSFKMQFVDHSSLTMIRYKSWSSNKREQILMDFRCVKENFRNEDE